MHAGRVIRGAVLTFRDDPAVVGPQRAVRFYRRGAVAVAGDGRIAWRGHAARLPQRFRAFPVDDHGEALVLPGFIDAHVHFPQHRMLAAPGRDLLDWLNRFTFPEERRYASAAHARAAAEAFLDRLVQHGTTAAVVFSTVHRSATEILFTAAERRRVTIVSGKTMMDRNAPEALRDDPDSGVRDSEALIERWHRRGRLRYAITVRFAVTSTEAQLRAAGALAARHPDCHVHSHLSESEGEIAFVRRLFPWAKDYTDVYDRFGLLGPRSLFAHGIHLSERECAQLSEAGATVVHCPTSNTFLGSGLFDAGHVGRPDRPVRIGIATDVGGGTSYSMLHTPRRGIQGGDAARTDADRARALPPRDPRQRGAPRSRRGDRNPRTGTVGGSGGARPRPPRRCCKRGTRCPNTSRTRSSPWRFSATTARCGRTYIAGRRVW